MVSRPPSGIASRALTARLRMAFSSWLGSTATFQSPPRQHGLDRDGLADGPAQQFRHALHQPVDVDRLDLLRMLAREREQPLHQRGGALGGLARGIEQALRCAGCRRRCGASAMSILPRMTVSMLLKSCAMPPDSRPTASIFCAWRSACSVDSRRLTSCCRRSVRRSAMMPRLTQRQRRRNAEDQMAAPSSMHPGAHDRRRLLDADA